MKALPLEASAHAKLNLCLNVGPRRSDGLHEICSLFQTLDLHDTLVIDLSESGADEIDCAKLDDTSTLTVALEAFRGAVTWPLPPLSIRLTKRIPVAAGLGGGSADAAALLRALARITQAVDEDKLGAIAASVGADVPAQLMAGLSLVTGAGESVERLDPLPEYGVVLFTSAEGISTAKIYQEFDLARSSRPLSGDTLREQAAKLREIRNVEDIVRERNDLQPVAFEQRPGLAEDLKRLEEGTVVAARMTGSGPTLFGLYKNTAEAEMEADRLGDRAMAARPVYSTSHGDYSAD